MQMGTGAIAAGAHIADNLAFFYIGAGAYCQAAHMGIGSLNTKIMADADITTIATIPARSLHIARGTGINRRAIIFGNINTRMIITGVAIKGISATAKIRTNLATIQGPQIGSDLIAIILRLDAGQKIIPILSGELQVLL